jgi:endonuclease/exonuclease/phosphatase family metal-dependent hydrolase
MSQPTSSRLLVRTWNLFHGNTSPRGPARHLERMLRLAVEDKPALVLLQELPVGALRRLDGWTDYRSFGAVAARPRLPAELGYRLTERFPQLRSAVEGQANAILVAPHLAARDHTELVLNPRRFRQRESERMALPIEARLAWAWERRVAQAVRVTLDDSRSLFVVNLHATNYRPDHRLADVELLRAASFADSVAEPAEAVALGGDFNVTVVSSPTLRQLSTSEWGFSAAGPGVDHLLIRGLAVVEPEARWPPERRRQEGVLLSDHAPVDVTVR